MSTCGSAWVCPVCASKIRYHRTDEVSRAIVSALDKGYDALFVTCTIPHSFENRLGVTLNLLAEGRRYVANQSVVKALRREAGYCGSITAKEITYRFGSISFLELLEQLEIALDISPQTEMMHFDSSVDDGEGEGRRPPDIAGGPA